jgi:hypothetical protein
MASEQDRYRRAMQEGGKRLDRKLGSGRARIPITALNPWDNRKTLWTAIDRMRFPIWAWLNDPDNADLAGALNLVLDPEAAPATVYRNDTGRPTVEVHAIRPITRRGRHGGDAAMMVVEVTQRRRGWLDPDEQTRRDQMDPAALAGEKGDFTARAGSTFFLDPATRQIGWVIPTAGSIADTALLNRMRRNLSGLGTDRANAFSMGYRPHDDDARDEPFALLHAEEE